MSNKLNNKKQDNYFMTQYKLILLHDGVGVNDKGAKKYFRKIIITCGVYAVLIAMLLVFKNSEFINYLIQGNYKSYYVMLAFIIYGFGILFSFTLYNIISYFYEKRKKHELLRKDIKGAGFLLYFLYLIINFPWITFTYIVILIEKFLKIENLSKHRGAIILTYSYSLFAAFFLLLIILYIVSYMMSANVVRLNNYINEITMLYLSVFVSILIFKKLQEILLGISLEIIEKNKVERNKIIKQNKLLLYYILVVITFILKAMNLTDEYKNLVDALFYSTNMLTMISTAIQKANAQS